MSNDPSVVLPEVTAMQEDWLIVDSLMGGTKAMRKSGLLEQMPDEDKDAYDRRLKRSTLYPAYSVTVQNHNGRVFAEPITITDDVPEPIKAYVENIDRQGNNLQVWAQSLFKAGLSKGLCHVLVDYPPTTAEDGTPIVRTKADEIETGVRPYAVIILPNQVLGWKDSEEGGEQTLTQFRYIESVKENDPKNEFNTLMVEQIRVLEPGKWSTYRKARNASTGKDEWVLHAQGITSQPRVMIATFYTQRTGFMTASPPLIELGHLNVKHWNEQSDQDKSTRFARIRLAVITGVENDDLAKVTISSDSMLSLPAGADVKVVQGSAESVKVGREELQALEDEMRVAGAKLLERDTQAVKTAAQADEEAAQEMSPLQTMAESLEDTLDQVLQFFADWMGAGEGGHVKVNGNFDVDYDSATTLPVLLNAANANKISDETFFAEMQRRGVVNGELDWEEEKERITNQGPALGTLTTTNPNADQNANGQ